MEAMTRAIVLLRLGAALSLITTALQVRAAGGDAYDDLRYRVEQATVRSPLDCGRYAVGDERFKPATIDAVQESISCGTGAAAARTPFWLMVEQGGLDSFVATGLLGGPDGEVRRFDYDSYGGGTFHIGVCKHPAAGRNFADRITVTCDGHDYPSERRYP
jgi:hypothetical protein